MNWRHGVMVNYVCHYLNLNDSLRINYTHNAPPLPLVLVDWSTSVWRLCELPCGPWKEVGR